MNPASRKFDPEKSILNQRAVDAERSAEAANARLALEVERSTALRAESDRRDRAAQAERRRLEAANRASRDAIARCEAELSAAAASAETEREKATALRCRARRAAPFRDEAPPSPASRRGSRRSGRRPDGRRSTAPPRGGDRRDAADAAGGAATARADRAEAELAQARARIVLEVSKGQLAAAHAAHELADAKRRARRRPLAALRAAQAAARVAGETVAAAEADLKQRHAILLADAVRRRDDAHAEALAPSRGGAEATDAAALAAAVARANDRLGLCASAGAAAAARAAGRAATTDVANALERLSARCVALGAYPDAESLMLAGAYARATTHDGAPHVETAVA
ncbi:hypothetical protein JL721_8549 [Aureococcus anophagefferens]|nr:hypothetical protein JL721_8549 [Aureococcus anophagefferens]